MMVLWITLLFLHQGYSLVQVKTVQLGEPATLTCALPNKELSSLEVHWYKQSVGDDLKLILTMYGTREPQYRQEIFRSRVKAFNAKNFSNLTILKTVQEDEGIYHCGIIEWLNPEWSATYLLVKGNTQKTSNYSVVQWPTVSDRVHPGDTTALQCLVLSDSENQTSTGDHDVFRFRVGSDKSHPSIIYTDRNKHNGCEKRSDLQNRCVYRFSKNVSSSDAGTYYCAVATCGEILFGNGTTLDIQVPESSMWLQMASTSNFLLSPVLVLIVIALLICMIRTNDSDHFKAAVLQKNFSDQKIQQDTQMFSTVIFTMMKADRWTRKDTNTMGRQQIYSNVKAFGLN